MSEFLGSRVIHQPLPPLKHHTQALYVILDTRDQVPPVRPIQDQVSNLSNYIFRSEALGRLLFSPYQQRTILR